MPDNNTIECTSAPGCPVNNAFEKLRQDYEALSQAMHTDPLTKLYNYRHFLEALSCERDRTDRTGQATTLIMIDIDHFKSVNDTWGHETGNDVLCLVADTLKQTIRKLDIACRYGGEEFAVILPSTDLLTGAQVAERLRAAVEDTTLDHQPDPLKVTISLGLASYYPNSANNKTLIATADKALYRAKKNGRNQVQYQEIPTQPVSIDEREALFQAFDPDSE